MIDITQLVGIHVRNSHYVRQLVIAFLRHFTFVDNDCIVQVTAFYQSGREKRLYFTNKDESTAGSHFVFEFMHIFKCSKLVRDDCRVIRNQYIQAKILIRQYDDRRTGCFITEFDFRFDDIKVFDSALFFCPYTFYFLYIILCAAVQNRKFRTIHLDEAVINAQCVKGCHTMLYGTYFDSVL